MPKKKSPHNYRAALESASSMDELCAVFLETFGETAIAQYHQALAIKDRLINSHHDPLEQYQNWRDLAELHSQLSRYTDNRVKKLAEQGIDINSLKLAYIMPDNLGETQHNHWINKGREFVSDHLDHQVLQEIGTLDNQIRELITANPDVSAKIHQLETEYVTPLVSAAQQIISQIRESGQTDELMAEFDVVQSSIESVHRTRIDPVLTESEQSLDNKTKAKLVALRDKKNDLSVDLMTTFYDSLISQSAVTTEDAQQWAACQDIAPSAISRLKKAGYSVAELRRDMSTLYQLANGRLKSVRLVTTGSRRASAIINTGTIDIDHDFDRRALFHEMSHLLEADESVKLANQHFIQTRASGTPQQLRKLTQNNAYNKNEIAIPDNFFSPYVGKVYPSGITEVASMGMQQFSSPEHMYALYESDPDMFTMMCGLMTDSSHTISHRQKQSLLTMNKGAEFIRQARKILKDLSWQKSEPTPARNTRWWITLGSCKIEPCKIRRKRGTYYLVTTTDKTGKDQIYTFKDETMAKIFMYVSELDTRNICPCPQDIYYLVSNKLAPDWYQSDTPLIPI